MKSLTDNSNNIKGLSNISFLIFGIVTTSILWSIFKLLFPNPNPIFDTYFYYSAAAENLSVNFWPIGYSKFIQLVIKVSTSAVFIVCLQFLLLQLSLHILFFSIKHLFKLHALSAIIFFICLFYNPLLFLTSNFLISDAIFVPLSIIWFTTLIWIIYHPNWYLIILQSLLLLLIFTIRYTALYYPIIATFVFLISPLSVRNKLIGILLTFGLLGIFYFYTCNKTAEISNGEKQFSVQAGWKLANNALYTYEYFPMIPVEDVPDRFRNLHAIVNRYFSKPHPKLDIFKIDYTYGSNYLFLKDSPLKIYMQSILGMENSMIDLKKMAMVSGLYKDYGLFLINKNPIIFFEHFIAPNALRYFDSPLESYQDPAFFVVYSNQGNGIEKMLVSNNTTISKELTNAWQKIININSYLALLIHVLFLGSVLVYFLNYKLLLRDKIIRKTILIIVTIWFSDFIFMSISGSIVLRYLLFIMVLELTLIITLINAILSNKKLLLRSN